MAKTFGKVFIAFATFSGLMISGAFAQTPERPGEGAAGPPPADSAKPGGSQVVVTQGKDDWLASKLKGSAVVGSDNQKIGDVADILLDKGGRVKALIVGVGGVLGLGAREVAVDLTQFREVPANNGNKVQLKVSMTKEQLTQAPEFKPLSSSPTTTGAAPNGSSPTRPPPR